MRADPQRKHDGTSGRGVRLRGRPRRFFPHPAGTRTRRRARRDRHERLCGGQADRRRQSGRIDCRNRFPADFIRQQQPLPELRIDDHRSLPAENRRQTCGDDRKRLERQRPGRDRDDKNQFIPDGQKNGVEIDRFSKRRCCQSRRIL